MFQTPWGYETSEQLPSLISAEQFSVITGGAFASSTERIEAMLAAVSSAIRDYCGWHISPSIECTYTGMGEGRILMLPAMGVTSVESLAIKERSTNYVVIPEFDWTAAGMVRLYAGHFPDDWRGARCTYMAGFDSDSLGMVVAQIAGNALAASPGVSDERAGNVSITYNKTGDGITGGVSLLPRDMALLAPYRLSRAR